MFRLFRQQSGVFDFVLDLKLFVDRGISVAKVHLLDFQSRKISRAARGGGGGGGTVKKSRRL